MAGVEGRRGGKRQEAVTLVQGRNRKKVLTRVEVLTEDFRDRGSKLLRVVEWYNY